ncbi:MAG: CPBP family intramembrane metalloprotease [Lachnospiraceae bacterium]|nr:CPBP family intramembrane metalloprotease [Lachnospiraceae bacterium]
MTKGDSKRFISYSMGLVISTIIIYFVLNILYKTNRIGLITANFLSLIINAMPFLLALFLAGMAKDKLELMRMKRRFGLSIKAVLGVVFMGILALLAGYFVVKEYTSLTIGSYVTGLLNSLKVIWYISIVGAVSSEAGFRGFLKSHFEKTYSVLGSSFMIGVVYSIWLTIFVFISENPSFLCLLGVAIQFILLSVFLGIITTLGKRNLYPAISFHFVWNLIAHTMNFQSRLEFLVYSNVVLFILCIVASLCYQIIKFGRKHKGNKG